MMLIVIAPDSFKGSARAAEVAAALADGWHRVRPDDDVVLRPMADGGEGTVDAVASALPRAELRHARVTGPDSRTVDARWLLLPAGDGPRTALVELAEASGLLRLESLAPLTSHTLGLGELLSTALRAGAERLLIGLGGSASTDGGAGALVGLGATLTDGDGDAVPLGNAGLHMLDRIDLSTATPPPHGGALVLSDVDNPLLGARGAVAVFGPQKGLDSGMARDAELALERFAALIDSSPERASARRPGTTPLELTAGAGAAGGTGFGLLAWGAQIAPGARIIAELTGLPEALADADLVITGEGHFDDQSAAGKVPVDVARLAATLGVSTALVAGAISAPSHGFSAAYALAEVAGSSEAAMRDVITHLRHVGALLAADLGR